MRGASDVVESRSMMLEMLSLLHSRIARVYAVGLQLFYGENVILDG